MASLSGMATSLVLHCGEFLSLSLGYSNRSNATLRTCIHCLGIPWRRILSSALSLRSMINSALRRRWEGRCSLFDSTLTRQIPLPSFEGEVRLTDGKLKLGTSLSLGTLTSWDIRERQHGSYGPSPTHGSCSVSAKGLTVHPSFRQRFCLG
ncbi:hypothetical protein HDV57DRAFT_485788 [Trichoderma longibrachiatum]|uniref:Uncharacterized protein n=1 Tax=Trichoderma longibrachiatum ATCC 18648 TaxID=983965 RepID=A0A2T4CC73_TRILO|nr:hypothetical protein M440DRAFT_229992 [Trichoderma longibrachiatum ATCC 18648]